MDLLLQLWVAALIEIARIRWMLGRGARWAPGRPLKLLFAGYNGTRNTGSDIRVHEMMRQIRHVLGPDRVALSVLSQNFDLTRGYFEGATQVHLPDVFPPFLFREVPAHDGVVACEGSMFKSTFANALTTMMVGSLGVAAAENKLSVGYGAEAGQMDPSVRWLVRRYARDSYVITRNPESAALLRGLGILTELGTDTAWTFEPHGPEYGRAALARAGWDGVTPVLVVCPINPFWWPVKPSLVKSVARAVTGAYRDSHYRTIYFHKSGRAVAERYHRYLDALATGIRRFTDGHPRFVALVAMEALDTDACHLLAGRLGHGAVFSSLDYDMDQLVSIARCGRSMVSSRYHGIVTTMAALLPSAGITMDERIRNLMHERGHAHLLLTVEDPDLGDKLAGVMQALEDERDALREGIGRTVVRNLELMARMGVQFERHLGERYPEFPVATGVRSWLDYLPPLSGELRTLLEKYG